MALVHDIPNPHDDDSTRARRDLLAPPGRFEDILDPCPRGDWDLGQILPACLGFLLWGVTGLLVIFNINGNGVLILFFSSVLFPVVAFAWSSARKNRRDYKAITAVLAAAPSDPVAALNLLVSDWLRCKRERALDEVVEHARRHGLWNITLRISRKTPESVTPIVTPFEPVRLGDVTGTCLDDAFNPARTSAQRWGLLRKAASRPPPLSYTIGLIIWLAFCLSLFRGGNVELHTIITFVMIASVLLVAVLAVIRNTDILLVPGGIILRRSDFGQSSWRFHLFARTQSILIARRSETIQAGWEVRVADAEQSDTFSIPGGDLTPLLRAWLSPLAPPEIDKMSDLR